MFMQFCSGSIVVLFMNKRDLTSLESDWFFGYNVTLPAFVAVLLCQFVQEAYTKTRERPI